MKICILMVAAVHPTENNNHIKEKNKRKFHGFSHNKRKKFLIDKWGHSKTTLLKSHLKINIIYLPHFSKIMITLKIKYWSKHLTNLLLMTDLIIFQQGSNQWNRASKIMYLQESRLSKIKKENKKWNKSKI